MQSSLRRTEEAAGDYENDPKPAHRQTSPVSYDVPKSVELVTAEQDCRFLETCGIVWSELADGRNLLRNLQALREMEYEMLHDPVSSSKK